MATTESNSHNSAKITVFLYCCACELCANSIASLESILNTLAIDKELIEHLFVVVSQKQSFLLDFFQKWNGTFITIFILKDNAYGWMRDLSSLEELFSRNNLVVIPDIQLSLKPTFHVCKTIQNLLKTNKLVFGTLPKVNFYKNYAHTLRNLSRTEEEHNGGNLYSLQPSEKDGDCLWGVLASTREVLVDILSRQNELLHGIGLPCGASFILSGTESLVYSPIAQAQRVESLLYGYESD